MKNEIKAFKAPHSLTLNAASDNAYPFSSALWHCHWIRAWSMLFMCFACAYVCTHIANETGAAPTQAQQQYTWKCAHNETFSIIFVGVAWVFRVFGPGNFLAPNFPLLLFGLFENRVCTWQLRAIHSRCKLRVHVLLKWALKYTRTRIYDQIQVNILKKDPALINE